MKIIINADDFGMTKSINKAIFELMELGSVTSTTVMVNMPYAEEAVKLIQKPEVSIGLHFNLTEGKPISNPEDISSLLNSKGEFLGKKELGKRAKQNRLNKDEILVELERQYNKLHSIIGDHITHLDSHQGLNRIPIIFSAVKEFGKEKKINGIRVYVKHYITEKKGKISIEVPGLLSFNRFGLKRVMVETYLKLKRIEINKYFKSPDGMMVSNEHQPIQVLKLLAKFPNLTFKNCTVEIPCHPAVDLVGLDTTSLTDERIIEYQFLKSKNFLDASKSLKLVSFKTFV